MRANSQSGQSSTEYMLVISVIVIAVVGSAYVFVQPFRDGTNQLAQDVSSILRSGQIGGVGLARNSGGGRAGIIGGAPNVVGGTGSTGSLNYSPNQGGKTGATTNGMPPPGQQGGSVSAPLGKPGMPSNGNIGVVGGPMFSKAPGGSNGGSTTSSPMGRGPNGGNSQ